MAYFKVGDMVEVTKPDYVLNASEQRAFSKYHNIGMVGDIDQQYVRVEIVGDYAWVKSEYIKLVMSFAPTEHLGAEIARLREQVDTLTRERDAAREALKPFAAAWEAWLRLLETEDEAEFGMHLFYEDIPQLDGHPFEDAYRAAFEAAANALADGGE